MGPKSFKIGRLTVKGAPNNSNESYSFIGLGRGAILGSAKTALKFKYEI